MMLGLKSFLLLFLIYTANGQFRRLSSSGRNLKLLEYLRPIPRPYVDNVPEFTILYHETQPKSDDILINANPENKVAQDEAVVDTEVDTESNVLIDAKGNDEAEADVEAETETEAESVTEGVFESESEQSPEYESTEKIYQCKKSNTFYAVPNKCDSFIACQKYVARKFVCPNGLHFNPKAKWPEYPCTSPSEANCASAIPETEVESEPKVEIEDESNAESENKPEDESTERPHLDFQCKEENSFYAIPHKCNSFVACQKYVAKKFVCNDGLHFNSKASWPEYPCTYPSEANCAAAIPESELDEETSFRPRPPFTSHPSPDDHSYTETPLPTTVTPQEDFECLEENAFYAILNECKSFIACQKYVSRKFVCPGELHFNPKANWPKYPCSYPSAVNCTSDKISYPRPPWDCRFGFGIFPSYNGDCGEYVVCDDGKATIMKCPAGLVFNPAISACDWPESVPTCNPKVFDDFKCPEPPRTMDGRQSEKTYTYRYKNRCSFYIACHKGEPRLLGCDSGLAFDEISGRCINSKAVQYCEDY